MIACLISYNREIIKINLINQLIKHCFGNLVSQRESLELPLAQDHRNSLNSLDVQERAREREEEKKNHKAPARISRSESCYGSGFACRRTKFLFMWSSFELTSA